MKPILNINHLMNTPWRQLTEEEQREAIRLARWTGERHASRSATVSDPAERRTGPEPPEEQPELSPPAIAVLDHWGASLAEAHPERLPTAELLESIDPRAAHYTVSQERELRRRQSMPALTTDRAQRDAVLASAKETELRRGRELHDRRMGRGRAGEETEADLVARYEAAIQGTNRAQALLAVAADEAAGKARLRRPRRRPPLHRRAAAGQQPAAKGGARTRPAHPRQRRPA